MRITIKDVAKLAGVSVGTVSNVFNGKRNVKSEVKKRVLEASTKLNYTPHAIARKLASKRTNTIGLFVLFPENERLLPSLWSFLVEIIQGMFDTLKTNGYTLQIDFSTIEEVERKNIFTKVVQEQSLDGIFILVHWSFDPASLFGMINDRFPFILVNGSLSGLNVNSVEVNNSQGSMKVVDYLVQLGHSRIGFVTGPKNLFNVAGRIEGYRESLRRQGLPYDEDLVVEGDFLFQGGYRCALQLLNLKQPPTAIFCANDHMAWGAIRAIEERGLHVPDDISIVGFDDQEIARMSRPPLTTVRLPLYNLGSVAAERLLKMLVGKRFKPPQRIVLDTELVIRHSCSKCKDRYSIG